MRHRHSRTTTLCHQHIFLVLFLTALISFNQPATAQGPPDVDVREQSVYRAVGLSTERTDGNAGGVGQLHSLCQTDFGDAARTCTTQEALLSPNLAALTSTSAAWVQPVLVSEDVSLTSDPPAVLSIVRDVTGLAQTFIVGLFEDLRTGPLSCDRWTDSTAVGAQVDSGAFVTDSCLSPHPVLCCAPQ